MTVAPNRTNEIGNTYGNLTVISYGYTEGKKSMWRCQCTCGNVTFVSGGDLRRRDGRNIRMCQSCGEQSNFKHGHTSKKNGYSLTYSTWHCMKIRVKRDIGYIGKGITVCEEWNDFHQFLHDMGERPSKEYTLDRIDPSKGYCKSNCRWATKHEQSRNRTDNIRVTMNGKTQILSDWLSELNLSYSTYYTRRCNGLTITEALNFRYQRTDEHQAKINASIRLLTEEQKIEVQTLRKDGMTFAAIAEKFGVSQSTIARACGRKY